MDSPRESADGAFGLPSDDDAAAENARTVVRRDRLLAALTLIAGLGLVLSMPFALKAGAEFFLPTTAALVIAIALVPVLEWLERRALPWHSSQRGEHASSEVLKLPRAANPVALGRPRA